MKVGAVKGLRKFLAIFLKIAFWPKSELNWGSMNLTGLDKDKKEKLDQSDAETPDSKT